MEIIKKYLNKNYFYISVIIMGLTSGLIGIFYSLFKNEVFERATNDFLEGTGVLGAYITESTGKPSETNYFIIGLLISIAFFFIVSFVFSRILNKKYTYTFNLNSFLSIILIIGLIFSSLLINISFVLGLIIFCLSLCLYFISIYLILDKMFKLDFKKKIFALSILLILVIIILVLLKLFV